MKITAINLRAYRTPRPRPIRNGRLTYATSTTCVVEVLTDEQVTGVGLGVGVMLPGGEQVVGALVGVFQEMLRGSDPLANERLWSLMWQPKLLGRRGVEIRVLSMIDIALWDIKAKVSNLPLHQMLGSFVEAVPYYVAGGYYEEGKDLAALADEMCGYVDGGAGGVKMKIGGVSVADDLRRVEAVRAALGTDVKLMVDANGAYDTATAVRMARALEPFDITWFEEPVEPDNYTGYAAVSQASSIPVAGGENEATRYGFRDLIAVGHPSVINPDAEILGGVTEYVKVAALAQSSGIAIAPHGRAELHAQLTCALPNGLMVEYYKDNVDPLATRLIPERPPIRDGLIFPSQRPGIGIVVDEEAAVEFRVL